MSDRDKKEEERAKKDKRIKKWLKCITGIVTIIAITVGLVTYVAETVIEGRKYNLEMQKYEDEKYEKELNLKEEDKKRHPQLRASMGDVVMKGEEKYQEIYLINVNHDITIEGGILGVDCFIKEQNEEEPINCCLNNVIYQHVVPHLKELNGSILLIRNNYQEFVEMVEKTLRDQGINLETGTEFQLYLFIYYEYTCGGENLNGYYKVEIKEEQCGAVEKINDLEGYFDAYMIDV